MRAFLQILLMAIVSIEVFADQPKENFFKKASYLFYGEDKIETFADGKTLFNNVVAHLQSNYFNSFNMEEVYLHALRAIEEADLPFAVKEKFKFVISNLVFTHLSTSDVFDMDEQDISGSLILGGVEILLGSLMHIIPGCAWLGKLVIADGIRRGFNGLEEMDESNKKQQKKFPSSFPLYVSVRSLK